MFLLVQHKNVLKYRDTFRSYQTSLEDNMSTFIFALENNFKTRTDRCKRTTLCSRCVDMNKTSRLRKTSPEKHHTERSAAPLLPSPSLLHTPPGSGYWNHNGVNYYPYTLLNFLWRKKRYTYSIYLCQSLHARVYTRASLSNRTSLTRQS